MHAAFNWDRTANRIPHVAPFALTTIHRRRSGSFGRSSSSATAESIFGREVWYPDHLAVLTEGSYVALAGRPCGEYLRRCCQSSHGEVKKGFVVTSAAPSEGNSHADFFATRWSVVLAAGGPDADDRRQRALEELARIYWFPLYAYARRQGHSPHAAEDLTQEFFSILIEKHRLRHVDQSKGKFRSFLLASIKHFLANEHDKSRAQKRGGPKKILALDAFDAEARYAIEPVDDMTPVRFIRATLGLGRSRRSLVAATWTICRQGTKRLVRGAEGGADATAWRRSVR